MEKLAVDGGTPVWSRGWPEWPVHDEREVEAIARVVRSGKWWHYSLGQALEDAGGGVPEEWGQVARFQRAFARYHDCDFGIANTSGTTALQVALRALGVGPEDEVIVPAYTFIATATAPALIGAVPVFVDVEPETYNIDPERVHEAITGNTKVIVPVHLGGQPANMDAINAIARERGLAVLEDAAQAHGAAYKGRKCGSLGDAAAFSFQVSKNVSGGEGGIITTSRPDVAGVCDSLVWVGRRPGDPWYRHYYLAGNARMTEFQAAILSVQLTRLHEQMNRRTSNARLLDSLLGEIEGIAPPAPRPETTAHAYHLYMLRYHPEGFGGWQKERFLQALNAEGIPASGGYGTPVYRNPVFGELDVDGLAARCPVAERACAREAVWIFQSLLLASEEAVHAIAQAIQKIQKAAHR